MRAWWLGVPFLLVACAQEPQQQRVLDRHGRLRAEVTRVNGKKQGPVRFFATNGDLQTVGRYARDSRHGAWTTVGPEGDTLSVVSYVYGRKHGLQGYWAPNGQLLRLEQFKEGAPHGWLYRFFADGSPRQITWYQLGVPDGPYLEWYKVDSTSVGLTSGQFQNGKRTGRWTWFYGNGKVHRQGRYANGKAVGIWRRWDPSGQPLPSEDHGAAPARPGE